MRFPPLACAVLAVSAASISPAIAGPIYGLPIGLVGATFSDGTALTGQFSLNVYGYMDSGYIETVAGVALDGTTPIGGYEFVKSATVDDLAASPDTPDVVTAGGAGYTLILTFAHSLGTPGADPFVLDLAYAQTPSSGECHPYACNDFGGISDTAKERLIATGVAFVPEPVSAALLGTGILGLLAAHRRRT